MRQQARARRALLDWLRWLVRRLHRAVAGVLSPHILDYLDRCRNVLVAFADLFVKQPQILAATPAMLLVFGQIVHNPFPDYIPCQRLPPAALLRLLWCVRLLVSIRLRVLFVL